MVLTNIFMVRKKIDESDRPFQTSKLSQSRLDFGPPLRFPPPVDETSPNNMGIHKKHFKKTNPMPLNKRISTIIETVTTKTSFSKVYNRLLCPQCIARIGLINGCLVSLSHLYLLSMLWCKTPLSSSFDSASFNLLGGPFNGSTVSPFNN